MFDRVVISCEHGGNKVPEQYQAQFEGADEVLQSHRGWDPGALELAGELAHVLRAPLYYTTVTRLLIEANRSLGSYDLYSQYTAALDDTEKLQLQATYYQPYRNAVENEIRNWITAGERVLHLSMHSFTPVLNGEVRQTDIGLLFDPDRESEAGYCEVLKRCLAEEYPAYVCRFNYPYLGTNDGHTKELREKFTDAHYAGIEIEVNQKYVEDENQDNWAAIKQAICSCIEKTLNIGEV